MEYRTLAEGVRMSALGLGTWAMGGRNTADASRDDEEIAALRVGARDTHLVDFRNEEFVSKVAKNAEEACKFVEDGFEFICNTLDELMVFRKRK